MLSVMYCIIIDKCINLAFDSDFLYKDLVDCDNVNLLPTITLTFNGIEYPLTGDQYTWEVSTVLFSS